jgi:Ran GTPase-activating protein (RanGAP) involved in mRNA processing and transport
MMSPPSGLRGETSTTGSNSHSFLAVSATASDLAVVGCSTSTTPSTSCTRNSVPPYGCYGNSTTTNSSAYSNPSATTTTCKSTAASTRFPQMHINAETAVGATTDKSSNTISIVSDNSVMNTTLLASPYHNLHYNITANHGSSPALSLYSPPTTVVTAADNQNKNSSISISTTGSDGRLRPTRESVLRRLSEALMRRSLTTIDMSQRDLKPSDAHLIKLALLQNKRLHTLKLGYNHLGDEGLITLSSALASSSSISSLDLGFTGVGDSGLEALANNISLSRSNNMMLPLQTLYLAGNAIGTRGALALARIIQFRCCHLKTLHLTGNKIGVDGIRSLTRAIAAISSSPAGGIEELFLGGTGLGSEGCHAVSEMLSYTPSLRVLSLADNSLGDREVTILADAIKENRSRLPLEALQLSFNRITCIGVESLMNAVWGSTSLLELRLDNNIIGDRGAQLVSVVIATVHSLERVDLGFNSFTATGMRSLMKSVSESTNLSSLSISGNKLDTSGAKAVAYALAYNTSLKYFFMDNCAASHESQRHITAGIVSNSDVKLLAVTGFRLGGTFLRRLMFLQVFRVEAESRCTSL